MGVLGIREINVPVTPPSVLQLDSVVGRLRFCVSIWEHAWDIKSEQRINLTWRMAGVGNGRARTAKNAAASNRVLDLTTAGTKAALADTKHLSATGE